MLIKNKKAQGASMPTEKVIKGVTVLGVVAIVILGMYFLNSSGLLKNILPSFGIENKTLVTTTADSASQHQYVVSLSVKYIISRDDYYFKYEPSVKNSLKIAMSINIRAIEGWYSDPEQNERFRTGDRGFTGRTIYDFEKTTIKNIMNAENFDSAVANMAEAMKNKDITLSWGVIQGGTYSNLGEISETNTIATLKLLLSGEQPKNA